MTYRDIVSTNQMTGDEATDLPVELVGGSMIGPGAFFATMAYTELETIMVVQLTSWYSRLLHRIHRCTGR